MNPCSLNWVNEEGGVEETGIWDIMGSGETYEGSEGWG